MISIQYLNMRLDEERFSAHEHIIYLFSIYLSLKTINNMLQ